MLYDMRCIMKVLVTGVCGQLRRDVSAELQKRGNNVIGTDIKLADHSVENKHMEKDITYIHLDITDSDEVKRIVTSASPEAIIHCAAWTAVDAAEDEKNYAMVDAVNHLGTLYLADVARTINARLLYVSTDYVFNGQGNIPWKPEDIPLTPLNRCGATKLAGEKSILATLDKYFIVRTSWLFGSSEENFVKTVISKGKSNKTICVVNDQFGLPTYTVDLARLLVDIVETEKYGIYHATNEGEYISWFDLCREVYNEVGILTTVLPVSTHEYSESKALRPYNSRLDRSKLKQIGFVQLPDWRDAVRLYLKTIMN